MQEAIKYWIAFADFYQWPHIVQFNGFDDLMAKLAEADLGVISRAMKAHNLKAKAELVFTWQRLFERMFHGLKPASSEPREQLADFDAAMQAQYGIVVSRNCVGDAHPPELEGPG
jgi:hypothetical protein